jgi:hypothetical protein
VQQFIAGIQQVLQVFNDRKTRADVGVVEEFAPRAAGGVA